MECRDPERVALVYPEDSEWRNRAEFFSGRATIKVFLQHQWANDASFCQH